MSISILRVLVILTILIYGCKGANSTIERGDTYEFQLGYPEIRVSTVGKINQNDQIILQIATEVVYSSLITKFENKIQYSEIEVEYKIFNEASGFEKSLKKDFSFESSVSRTKGETFTLFEEVPVSSGDFHVIVIVRDLSSDKESIRKTLISIPDSKTLTLTLTDIQLLAKDNADSAKVFFPVTTYDVASRMDSLRFTFQITNHSKKPITIKSKLVYFEADSLPALPLILRERSVPTLQYKGIELTEPQEVFTGNRILNQSGSVSIEFTYPILKKGNYRFKVEAFSDSIKFVQKARDFSIKSINYPAIIDVKEFAHPLYYIMDKKEYAQLLEIEDKIKLKEAIDRFWLKNIGDTNKAKSVIERYYNRVEQANKLFSNYKEGWKTDLGMIYILFGEPWYVYDDVLDELIWGYSYNSQDPTTNFSFHFPKSNNKYFPFDNAVLKRSPNYYKVYYNQIELWLSGNILIRNL